MNPEAEPAATTHGDDTNPGPKPAATTHGDGVNSGAP